MLSALRESGGGGVAVTDAELTAAATDLMTVEGIDAAPEGGAALAGANALLARGDIRPEETVLLFNTGAGWLYRG
jgi:threonine synthase